jgi:hypothetical protein
MNLVEARLKQPFTLREIRDITGAPAGYVYVAETGGLRAAWFVGASPGKAETGAARPGGHLSPASSSNAICAT